MFYIILYQMDFLFLGLLSLKNKLKKIVSVLDYIILKLIYTKFMSFYPSSLIRRFYNTPANKRDISEFALFGCLHPKKINYVNSLGAASSIYVPCGHCLSCQDDRRNQLAARMFLHDKYTKSPWQHVYFITLTYGSYNLNLYEEHPFKSDWLSTYPVLSAFNEKKHPAWTPSILRQEHIVKFIKRLRQQHPFNTFSYVYCGEYGETYFRPHFHIVLWSLKSLTANDIRNAWSYKGVRTMNKHVIKPYRGQVTTPDMIVYCPIGQIKFVDLVANGSTAYKVRGGDSRFNAMHNFTYVAKYLAKPFDVTSPVLEQRLRGAYDCVRLADMTPEDENPDFFNNKILYSNVTFTQFKAIVAPFTTYSRRYSIGKGYALENLTRFEEGNFALPDFRGVRLSFPSYFLEVLNRKRFPLRFQKTTASGFTFTKSNLLVVRDLFLAFHDNKAVVHSLSGSGTFASLCDGRDHYKEYDQLVTDFSAMSSYSFVRFLDSLVWKDEQCTFYFRYSYLYDIFEQVYYDVHKREYISCGYISRESYCNMVIDQIDKYCERYKINEAKRLESVLFFDEMQSPDPIPEEPGVIYNPNTVNRKVMNVRMKRIEDRSRHNKKYNINHLTKDNL